MPDSQTLHATAVALSGKAVLITGASGQGKSALALELMALGCTLVADDRVILERRGDALWASSPPQIRGMIEARFVGLLAAQTLDSAKIDLVVDLDHTEHARLPQERTTTLLHCRIRLITGIKLPHLAPTILQILKAGWSNL